MVNNLKSFTRDSTHLMQLVEDLVIPDGTLLVTMDVESLYTSIVHQADQTIEFLDIRLSIEQSSIVCTLYRKPTSTNSLLHYTSFHPQHLKNGIPKGQFLRLKRNCSKETEFVQQSRDLSERFKRRGYPQKNISRAYQYARQQDRKNLFQKKVRDSSRPLSLITTFNNQWSDIRHVLERNWGILMSDTRTIPFISSSPCLVARRARNLKDNLCHSHYQRPVTKLKGGKRTFGSYPCGNCNICQFMIAQDGFSVSTLSFQIQPKEFFTCRSRNLVYAIFCDCPKIYVGQTTQEIRRRMQQHLSNISTAKRDRDRSKTLTSVAAHFLDRHHGKTSSFKVMGLESVKMNIRGGDIHNHLLRCETKWIYELQSLAPKGLNEELLFTGYYKQL
ncbi:uncharacterized protein [Ranitomeya imitator]|uniref:uncharacterized protein n=1 Tax=Ranitomeya imitator TaxID=111125 RepID=UPI0037E87CB8